MTQFYNVNDWYWVVAGSSTHVYSSASQSYVSVSDSTYLAWVAAGGVATPIATEALLYEVLNPETPSAIERDLAEGTIDPTDGGPWSLTATSGKFYPPGSTLLLIPFADQSIRVIGETKAYDGTDLTVSLRATNATVSQTYSLWSVSLLDSPPAKLPLLSIAGLKVSRTPSARSLEISAGSIMDSTGTVFLTLDDPITKTMTATFAVGDGNGGIVQTAALAGTVTSTGDDLAGSGTAFNTDFDAAGAPTDFINQGGAASGYSTNIAIASATDGIERIDSDTDIEGWITLGASSSAYYRNGPITTSGSILSYFVTIIRRDTDGLIDVCITSWNPVTGEPDLPSGFTYYRVIAAVLYTVSSSAAVDSYVFEQPLYERQPLVSTNAPVLLWVTDNNIPGAKTITGSGDVVQTTLSSTISLDVGNNKITNAKAADMASYTLKGRNAGTTGDPSDISISSLTEKTTTADGDWLLISDSAASGAFKKVNVSNPLPTTALFPSGQVFNYGSGNVTVTHSSGYLTYTGILRAPVLAAQRTTGGYITVEGHASQTGYLAWYNASGTRISYAGFDNTNLTWVLENGANLHVSGGYLRAPYIQITDGVTTPGTVSGQASIYVDSADGDLKIKFGDGTVKTIVTD